MPDHPTRRLAAILFTDIVGYTALMQRDEASAVSAINRHQIVLEERVKVHQGNVLQYYGDGSLSIFDSASEAVRCAMEIQAQLQQEPKVPLRVGLHIGEILFDNGKVLGDGVNVASRIESMGVPGAVLLSREVYSKIRNRSEFSLEPLGTFEFKNVEEAVGVFAIANEGFVVPEREVLEGKFKVSSDSKSVKAKRPSLSSIRQVLLVLLLILAGGFIGWFIHKISGPAEQAPKPIRRMTMTLPEEAPAALIGDAPAGVGQRAFDISPDGKMIAFVAQTPDGPQLALRPLDSYDIQLLPDTKGAYYPFFSPDGKWIGYFAREKLFKISVSGNSSIFITEVSSPYGAFWRENDDIIYVDQTGDKLVTVSALADNPKPTNIEVRENFIKMLWPAPLPNPNYLLLTSFGNLIFVVDLSTGKVKPVYQGANTANYVSSGHLVFSQSGRLMAVRFDPETLEISGTPIPVLDHLRTEDGENSAQFAFSEEGTLVYASGNPVDQGILVFVDRAGKERKIVPLPPNIYLPFDISPDNKFLVYQFQDRSLQEMEKIWIYDLEREVVPEIFENEGFGPIWALGGKSITYSTRKDDQWFIIDKSLDGHEVDTLLIQKGVDVLAPADWSADKRILLVAVNHPKTFFDIMALDLSKPERGLQAIVASPKIEVFPKFSPNADYFVYRSENNIVVEPFPPTGKKFTLDNGDEPFWSADGNEIIYRSGDFTKMMAVPIDWSDGFSPGKPDVLWEGAYPDIPGRGYAITSDGALFLMKKSVETKHTRRELQVVENWFEDLKRLLPNDEK